MIAKEKENEEIIAKYGRTANDTGSPERVRVALFNSPYHRVNRSLKRQPK